MKCWTRIKTKYVETKAYWNRTGVGLMPNDEFRTIEEKKEGMCPMFKELDAIYGEKPNIKALKVHDSMLTPSRALTQSSSTSTSTVPLSRGSFVDSRGHQETQQDDLSGGKDSGGQGHEQGHERQYTDQCLGLQEFQQEDVYLGQPIPTFMDMNDVANTTAEAALFAFMPNTYNFAKETYDYPHDTYDFEKSESPSNLDGPHLDANLMDTQEDGTGIEMTKSVQNQVSFFD